MAIWQNLLRVLGLSKPKTIPITESTAKDDGGNDKYVLSREFGANNRQNLQFFVWTDDGFLLHPSIPISTENMRVAEIGVGTGIWLTKLSRALPTSAQIDGFDINLTAAPPQEWMPSNVKLHVRDMLKPVPDDLIGKYDLVHIQLFHLAVENNDPVPIIKNLLKMLKPGGYISWGEYDYSKWSLVRTSAAPKEDDELTRLMDFSGNIHGDETPSWIRNYWPAHLPETYASLGLTDIATDNRELPPEMIAYQLDAALAACEEMSYNVLDKLGNGEGLRMRDMVNSVYGKRKYIGYNVGRLTVVGRKPLMIQE